MELSHTTDAKLRLLLNFKTITGTECDLLPTASALTETGNKKNLSSKFRFAKLQYVINVCAKF